MIRDPRAATMPEDRGPDSLDAHVRKLMADLGLFGYHTRNSKGSTAGWPDWVIIGRVGILYRELKPSTAPSRPNSATSASSSPGQAATGRYGGPGTCWTAPSGASSLTSPRSRRRCSRE
jgi:hypothetical protein